MNEKTPKLRRREFLANLLFAGGALTVTSLQSQLGELAFEQKIEEGWELPEEIEDRLKRNPPLNPRPRPRPTKTPRPRPQPRPPRPQPKGSRTPPMPGGMRVPPPKGKGTLPSSQ